MKSFKSKDLINKSREIALKENLRKRKKLKKINKKKNNGSVIR
tara:strand:- start:204 stop:332 length:129 start_codon:yes stop_codon:yes gene_type:complete